MRLNSGYSSFASPVSNGEPSEATLGYRSKTGARTSAGVLGKNSCSTKVRNSSSVLAVWCGQGEARVSGNARDAERHVRYVEAARGKDGAFVERISCGTELILALCLWERLTGDEGDVRHASSEDQVLRWRFKEHTIGAWSPGLCESLTDTAQYMSGMFCHILLDSGALTE